MTSFKGSGGINVSEDHPEEVDLESVDREKKSACGQRSSNGN